MGVSGIRAFPRLQQDWIFQSSFVGFCGIVSNSLVQTDVVLVVEVDGSWHIEVPPDPPGLLLEESPHPVCDIEAIFTFGY